MERTAAHAVSFQMEPIVFGGLRNGYARLDEFKDIRRYPLPLRQIVFFVFEGMAFGRFALREKPVNFIFAEKLIQLVQFDGILSVCGISFRFSPPEDGFFGKIAVGVSFINEENVDFL